MFVSWTEALRPHVLILTNERTYRRLAESEPFDGANGGSFPCRYHLVSSVSINERLTGIHRGKHTDLN